MINQNLIKFNNAVHNLKPNVGVVVYSDDMNEDIFNTKTKWEIGTENGVAILSETNPHLELTWTAVKTEMDKLWVT